MQVAKQRAFPATKAMIGDRYWERYVDADHADLDVVRVVSGSFTIASEDTGAITVFMSMLLEDPLWVLSFKNSLLIAFCATVISTALGTLAALGLCRANLPCKGLLMGTLISPMIVPVIISSAGMYFFYSALGIGQNHLGIILGHAVLGTPFVIITVTATLVGFDHSLTRAATSLGASSTYTFFRVTFPIIRPGIMSGALFAMVTSFDEAVLVQFLGGVEQRTIPRQMWSGMREQISPTILAAATLLILGSVALLVAVELMRRRSLRLRGIKE
jgi:putative spermidine/putrescine transport system permease protein